MLGAKQLTTMLTLAKKCTTHAVKERRFCGNTEQVTCIGCSPLGLCRRKTESGSRNTAPERKFAFFKGTLIFRCN